MKSPPPKSSRPLRARPFSSIVLLGVCAVACSSSEGGGRPDASADGASGANASGGASAGGASNGGGSSAGRQGGGAPGAGGDFAGGANASGVGGSSNGGSAGNRAAGAAGRAAGGADAGAGVDAGSAGAAPDPCATARFCEHFEDYPAGSPPGGMWKTQTNLGAVSVVTDEHFGGSKAAKFSTQMSSGGKTAFIKLAAASVFPVPGNVYFGRMMFRLESAPTESVHWTFIQSGGMVTGQNYHALYRYGGQQPVTQNGSVGSQLMANYDTPDSYSGTGPSSDCWDHSNKVVVPVGRWACAEWQFDGPNDTMRFWLDGAAVDSLTMQHTGQGCVHQSQTFEWQAPSFADLELGWESYQADSERTLYLDDVVVATARVGCPPP